MCDCEKGDALKTVACFYAFIICQVLQLYKQGGL